MRLLFLAYLLCFCTITQAKIITIDPDDFAAGEDISNSTPGVTLSTYSNNYFGGTSIQFTPMYAVDCQNCSTGAFNGEHVFGPTSTAAIFVDSVRPTLADAQYLSFLTFRADFLNPTNYVQIIGGAFAIGNTPVALFAYDASDNLLASCTPGGYYGPSIPGCDFDLGVPTPGTTPIHFDPWSLNINTGAFNISYVIAGGLSAGSLVKSLSFASVPEPSSWALMCMGVFLVALLRRDSRSFTTAQASHRGSGACPSPLSRPCRGISSFFQRRTFPRTQ